MSPIRIGVQMKPQHTSYADFAAAVQHAEELGLDTIWNWDHFFPLSGEPDGLHYEGWTTLTAMVTLTKRVEVGCLVICNSYRNPQLLADMSRTLDHISNGRYILGIGAGWFERDYNEYGYEFGTAPDRLRHLRDSLPLIMERWQKLNPPPTRQIPVLIGGGGEKVTLKLTAQYATIWNGFGPPETFRHKNDVLDNWCKELGRDPKQIERSVTVNDTELDDLDAFVEAGAEHIILGWGAPWDASTVQRLVDWRNSR